MYRKPKFDYDRFHNYDHTYYTPDYKDSYEDWRRREKFHNFLCTIGIAILAVLACFFKKVHSRKLWKEFFISTTVLFATGFLCYAISTKTTPDVFTWGGIISFAVYCIYWCII